MLAGDRHRAQVVRVEPGRGELPGIATVRAEAEALGRGHEHDLGARGMGQDLVDVVLDVHRGRPRRAAVTRACDAADVDIHVDRAVAADADGPHIRGIAPRRVPGATALRRLERIDRHESVAGQPQEVSLLGADDHAYRRAGDTCGCRTCDRSALRPGAVLALPQ